MEKKDSKGVFVIGLLVGLIIMLIVISGLFVTNIIRFNSNVNDYNEKSFNNEDKVSEKNETAIKSDNLDNKKYNSIIEEYKKALNDKDFNNNVDTDKIYPNINDRIIHLQASSSSVFSIYYIFYDVNKDGNNEMIVGDGENGIYEMYTYNGSKPIRFYNQGCLGERCSSLIYDNGIIYFYGAGGAMIHGLDFYKIGSDGYSKENFKSYSVEIDSSSNVKITDYNSKEVTNFKSDNEVISSVVGDSQNVDLSKLSWIEIK